MTGVLYGLFGVLLAGYLVLGGADFGIGLLLPAVPGGAAGRRGALAALGPFFLGNEVWVLAAAGVLAGAFPRAEGELFAAAYPAVLAVVLGLVGLNAGVQLRSRPASWRGRAGFDALIAGAASTLAVGWGVLFGAGLGVGLGVGPGARAAAVVGFAALAALHGAAVLCWRLDSAAARERLAGERLAGERLAGERLAGERLARLGARLLAPVAVLAVGVTAVAASRTGAVRRAAVHPGTATAVAVLLLVAVAAAGLALRAGRFRVAVAATALAMVLPLAAVAAVAGAGPVTGGAAGPATLRVLGWSAAVLVPLLAALQVAAWRTFGRRPAAGGARPVAWYW
jgi:cytochrome bd-type quinol oxidase subunit 2